MQVSRPSGRDLVWSKNKGGGEWAPRAPPLDPHWAPSMHRFWRWGGAQAKPAIGLFEKNGNLFSSLLMNKGPFCPSASSRRTASYPSPLNDGNRRRLGWSASFLHNLIACSRRSDGGERAKNWRRKYRAGKGGFSRFRPSLPSFFDLVGLPCTI